MVTKNADEKSKRTVSLFAFVAGFVLSGCSTADLVTMKSNYNFSSVPVDLNEVLSKSDPQFIDRLLLDVELPSGLASKLSYAGRISVLCLDSVAHPENRAQLFVGDRALIGKLIEKNYTVVARDRRALARILADGSSDERNFLEYYFGSKAESLLTKKPTDNLYYATKLLAYRILELGVTGGRDEANNSVLRVGRVEIELRLVDAQTSCILYSDIVRGYAIDTLSESEYQTLKGIHYRFAPDALPLVLNLQPREFINVASLTKTTTGEIAFLFATGSQVTRAYIMDESSGELVQSFRIPSSADTPTFEYKWDPKD
ncbi:MAG: hypothetical protein ACPL7O_10930 [Armatimonadota bacterium]